MYDPIFPGMDPFIEDQRWPEFHNATVMRIQNELARLLAPRYNVVSESYIQLMRPDISVLRGKPGAEPLEHSRASIAQATRIIEPTLYEVDEHKRVEIRDGDGKLVTVIEVLSPANKDRHRDRYLANRDAILYSDVHLVEIDLLRCGERMEAAIPAEGYAVLVARAQPKYPHRGELYEIGLRDALPVVPVPLLPGDDDVPLDLATLFKVIYTAARYRVLLDYTRAPGLPFAAQDQKWIESILS